MEADKRQRLVDSDRLGNLDRTAAVRQQQGVRGCFIDRCLQLGRVDFDNLRARFRRSGSTDCREACQESYLLLHD